MKLSKNRGVSLIVLVITIIVIIILAGTVILSMMQNNPITKANEAVFKLDVATYQDQLEMYHLNKISKEIGNYERSNLNKTGEGLKEVIPSIKESHIEKFEIKSGKLIYIGTEENEIEWANEILVNSDDSPENPENPEAPDYGVNAPALAEGMTPIKWNGTTWVDTTTSDLEWYNYDDKEWANAKTLDGSMWVWIPRYEYQIPNPHTSTIQTILINFKQGINTSSTSGYIVHPAFTFGTTELTGIWVAKFEASGTTSEIDIKPGIVAIRNIKISEMFTACRNMEINSKYGWGTIGNGIDTHLIKNVEWGAVVYLSHSTYGINGKIVINNNNYYAGGGTGTSYISNISQSTTGNITGIYDMTGGTYEYTAAYVDNENSILTTNGSSIVSAESKYKDIYAKGSSDTQQLNYEANLDKVGDSIYETSLRGNGGNSSWYSDASYMPYSYYPFFSRRGDSNSDANVGAFGFRESSGTSYNNYGFRPVLNVDSLI